MLKEFKQFILRGNVIDLAVGVIIGSAFTAIVTSFTKNLISPLLGLFLGKINFSKWVVTVGSAQFKFGNFINSIIDFLIIAFVIFLMVKLINKLFTKNTEDDTPVQISNEEMYLKEIRDLLAQKNK
ncbi:large-conductance mechanosensitive channel protein MscL [Paucilactobacillus sp. N302-9]